MNRLRDAHKEAKYPLLHWTVPQSPRSTLKGCTVSLILQDLYTTRVIYHYITPTILFPCLKHHQLSEHPTANLNLQGLSFTKPASCFTMNERCSHACNITAHSNLAIETNQPNTWDSSRQQIFQTKWKPTKLAFKQIKKVVWKKFSPTPRFFCQKCPF